VAGAAIGRALPRVGAGWQVAQHGTVGVHGFERHGAVRVQFDIDARGDAPVGALGQQGVAPIGSDAAGIAASVPDNGYAVGLFDEAVAEVCDVVTAHVLHQHGGDIFRWQHEPRGGTVADTVAIG